ncbi:hypothetical protein LXJ56_27705, partial [Escherichia coli]|nr:hypothetical protein [Escherichia coli]
SKTYSLLCSYGAFSGIGASGKLGAAHCYACFRARPEINGPVVRIDRITRSFEQNQYRPHMNFDDNA